MRKYLAIDIGASSGRHILGYTENGTLRISEIYRFSNAPQTEGGALTWDVERLFAEILAGLKRAKELGCVPDFVGVDTWAVDYVLLDRAGKRVGPVSCYRDPAAEEAARAVHRIVPFEWLYGKTGIQFQPFNSLYRLYADRRNGRLESVETLLMLPDYFHYLLTGIKSREYTNATSTGLVNAHSGTWDEDILQALSLPRRLFPPVTRAGTVLGGFLPAIQKAVGYDAHVVLPATHDTASAATGALAEEGQPYLSSGTWSLLGVIQRTPHTDARSRAYNYSNEGHVDGKFRYQKNITGLWMVNKLRAEECPQISFGELTSLAAQSRCTERVDVNDRRFLAPKNMKAELEAAAGRTFTVPEAVYCALRSLAGSYRTAIEELVSVTGERCETLNVIGGGSNNALLNDMTAEETNMRVVAGPAEATAVGNLVMQMIASGEFRDGTEAKKLIKNSHKEGYI